MDKKEIGEFWSFKKEGAKCYDAYHGSRNPGPCNILYGLARKQDVDWNLTLEANISNPDEYEITLKERAPIKVTNIENSKGKLLNIQFEGVSYG